MSLTLIVRSLIKEVFCSPVSQSGHPADVGAIQDLKQTSLKLVGLMVRNTKAFNTAKFNLNDFQWLSSMYVSFYCFELTLSQIGEGTLLSSSLLKQ